MNQKTTIDTKQNTEIVYLYVKEFSWIISWDREVNLGHPLAGRVYRAVYNKETLSYRLIFKSGDEFRATFIPLLVNKDHNRAYTSDISILTWTNIIDFNIVEEDLDALTTWMDTADKDLLDKLWNEPKAPTNALKKISSDEFVSRIADLIQTTDPEFAQLLDNLHALRELNPTMVGPLLAVTYHILNDVPRDSPIDGYWLRIDKKLGTGANLSAAIEKLSRYGSSDRKTNREHKDLMGAIKDLLIEQQRRDINH